VTLAMQRVMELHKHSQPEFVLAER
jgi:hypothetical protein